MVDSGDVTIPLSADEALVLFELLHRREDCNHVSAPQQEAEQTLSDGRRCGRSVTEAYVASLRRRVGQSPVVG